MKHSSYRRYNFLVKNLSINENSVVVDCACGIGEGTKRLLECSKNVIYIDLDEDSLSKARKLLGKDTHKNCYKASICNLPLDDNHADIFVSSETLEHLNQEETKQAVNEIKRVCKKDSIVAITVPDNITSYINNPLHKQHLTSKQILNLFKPSELVLNTTWRKRPDKLPNRVVIFKL